MTPATETAPNQGVAPELYPHGLTQEAKAAIDDIIASRIVISFRELNACFRAARGIGISRHTLKDWQAEGMPVHHHPNDRFYFYHFWEVWAWYCARGSSPKKTTATHITAQSWAIKR